MRYIIVLTTVVVSFNSFSQTTIIPDANFEQALIDIGLDTGATNGLVPTVNLLSTTFLNVQNMNISDLTGIEDFTNLSSLWVGQNQLSNLNIAQNTNLHTLFCEINLLTSLDVTQNTGLTRFRCYDNQLTSLDVTQNTALDYFVFSNNNISNIDVTQNTVLSFLAGSRNQFTSIDISQNTNLTSVNISYSLLTNLDVSQNPNLVYLQCIGGDISCLNVKNGNNVNFSNMLAYDNPNLTCIEVDDINYSNANWTNIDAQTSYSMNCGNSCSGIPTSISLQDNINTMLVYPNPSNDIVNIDNGNYLSMSRYTLKIISSLGQVVFNSTINIPVFSIPVSALGSAGTYYIQVFDSSTNIVKTEPLILQ